MRWIRVYLTPLLLPAHFLTSPKARYAIRVEQSNACLTSLQRLLFQQAVLDGTVQVVHGACRGCAYCFHRCVAVSTRLTFQLF